MLYVCNECYVKCDTDLSLLQLEGYTCISVGQTCSAKGGLIIYLNDRYNFTGLSVGERSELFEGQFILPQLELHGL